MFLKILLFVVLHYNSFNCANVVFNRLTWAWKIQNTIKLPFSDKESGKLGKSEYSKQKPNLYVFTISSSRDSKIRYVITIKRTRNWRFKPWPFPLPFFLSLIIWPLWTRLIPKFRVTLPLWHSTILKILNPSYVKYAFTFACLSSNSARSV